MKTAAALLGLLMTAAPAFGQSAPPSCWVVSGATGYTMAKTDTGMFAAWWCATEWTWTRTLLVARSDYVIKHPAIPPGASAASTAEAYWRENVNYSCAAPNRNDPAMLALCDLAYNASLDTRPASRWIVAPYPGATYRATYATSAAIDGVRNRTSNGRVLITTDGQPTPCYCASGRVTETSSTGAKTQYCSASITPTTVAACQLR